MFIIIDTEYNEFDKVTALDLEALQGLFPGRYQVVGYEEE